MSRHLYELTAAMNYLIEAEDVNELDLAAAFGDIQEKAQNICQVVTMLEADAQTFQTEETRLAERRKAIENRAKQIREYLKSNMLSLGIDKIKAGIFSLKLQDNPPAVEVTDESAIPARYFTIIPESKQLDKKRVLDAIKNGESVTGCNITRGKSLRIR